MYRHRVRRWIVLAVVLAACSSSQGESGQGDVSPARQLLWADPASSTIVAINSLLASALPAPFDHFEKLYHAAIDIVTHYRAGP